MEGFDCFQRWALVLEKEKRNRWGIHDRAIQVQHMMIHMQQEKIKKLEEELIGTATTGHRTITSGRIQ